MGSGFGDPYGEIIPTELGRISDFAPLYKANNKGQLVAAHVKPMAKACAVVCF